MERHELIVIGGGPAGLAAAVAARKAGVEDVLILEREDCLGGILNQCIHHGFGLHRFKEELTGPEYAQRWIDEAAKLNIPYRTGTMVLELTSDRVLTCTGRESGLQQLQADAVILAMGCRERPRGALNIPGYRPAGVYSAGTAQRLINIEGRMPGREVVILGSGDIGLIMARRMTWEGAKVKLVCELMPYSSGLNRNIVQCLDDNDIPLKFNHTITRIHGRDRVTGVTISEVDPATRRPIPGSEFDVSCDTVLLSVGLIPENELTTACGVAMDRVTSGAVVDENRQTSVPGIFACGNVLHVHDLVDNVSEEAMLAGRAAAAFAAGNGQTGDVCNVHPEGAVRYCVPQQIHGGGSGKIDLYFRVGRVCRPASLTVRCGDQVLLTRKKLVMTPGEMEKISVDASKITGDVTLSVE